MKLDRDFTTEDTENTESLLPYPQVPNQDLRVLRALRGWNPSIHEPSPAPFAVPTEKRTWTPPSLIAVASAAGCDYLHFRGGG